jgi:Tfp pilus assembly protein PilF
MSLLLQALQKAAKTRDGAEGEQDTGAAGAEDLSLEPLSEPKLGADDAPARSGPSSAQAATVIRASEPPSFTAVDWAREHYMLTFVGAAILFAIGYGTYVYVQVSNPGLLRGATPPASPLGAAAPLVAPAPEPQSAARISGLPAIDEAAPASPAATVAASTPPTVDIPKPAIDRPRASASARAPRRPAQPEPQVTVARSEDENGLETVEIPASLPVATSAGESRGGDIAVRRQPAGAAAVNATLLAAYEALQAGDYPRARTLYDEVLASDPRSIDALLGLAAISWKHERFEDAVAYYGRVLQADPRNAHAQAGLIAMLGGADPLAAESRLKQIIAREPSGFLYFTLGNLYAEQGQWPSAQQAYFQARQLSPENADYAFNLAVSLEHLSQPKLALDHYRKALDLSFKRGRANFDQKLAIERVGQLSARVD